MPSLPQYGPNPLTMKNLRAIMAEEANSEGAITFARFMELALYCPNIGYYTRPGATTGRSGDFFTSVSVGSLFGQLLAFQFAEWLGTPERPVQLVEAGAHDARLACDILAWLQAHRPALRNHLEYWIIEPSESRIRTQQQTLGELAASVRWFPAWSALPPSGVNGIIFSNELLDAMPTHRLGWDANKKEWFEWGVAVQQVATEPGHGVPPLGGRASTNIISDEATNAPISVSSSEGGAGVRGPNNEPFIWIRMPVEPATLLKGGLSNLPPELLAILPNEFTTEVNLAAIEWWQQAAAALRSGKLLTIDYGLTADEFLLPERHHGTLRAYHRHQVSSNLLARPGEQDLTAHVNFTAIQNAGEAQGLSTETFQAQAQFLIAILRRIEQDRSAFGEWTAKHARQFQTLTHPAHLGRSFRVLIQSR